MREGVLKELQGAARLTRGFFNSLIRRIECTKPLAGSGVSIVERDDGIEISASAASEAPEMQTYTLNICEDGETRTLEVYGPPDQ